jgi:divalent metal cation (Fe/Co/Zn/Cd) transporter
MRLSTMAKTLVPLGRNFPTLMSELVQIDGQPAKADPVCPPSSRSNTVVWLQVVTLIWMFFECGASLYAAVAAHSPALLAFGSDSFVELLSAAVVLLRLKSPNSISQRTAARLAAVLLFVLASIVVGALLLAFLLHLRPETSRLGITVTIAALIAMPLLAALKRREARRTNNVELAADAVQSATCAYLALATLSGLAVNAVFHLPWFDSLAALIAIPFLLKEGRSAWRGQICGCC